MAGCENDGDHTDYCEHCATCHDCLAEGEEVIARDYQILRDQREALQKIANWDQHTVEFSLDNGSNGVREVYRTIARKALDLLGD